MARVFEPVHTPAPPPPVYSLPHEQSLSPQINVVQEIEDRNGAAVSQNKINTSLPPTVSMPHLARTRGSAYEAASHGALPLLDPQIGGGEKILPPPVPLHRSPLQDPHRLSPATVPKRGSPGLFSNDSLASQDILYTPTSSDRPVSPCSAEPQPAETFEPLRYHHLPVEDPHITALNDRASRLTIGTVQSETSTGSDQQARNSTRLRTLPRPDSGFSSAPELRGRASEAYLSPAKPPSSSPRHSRSPEARPVSYIDLLNVPYSQTIPSGAENLVNSGLRDVIGSNAALMSTRKTLEMYRANVKKTNDPAIQYEFAVFMVGAAQEEGLETDGLSEGGKSERSSTTTREDLLKEAKQILQKLCDKSYPFAQYYLGDGYASGLFNKGREDWDKGFPLFLAAAKHGHAEAGYRAALCYEFGWGCRPDAIKALQFYQHAASKNHPGAMARLGRACLTGEMGLTKRYREGIRWLKRAAESADFQYNHAPYDLGCLHETGFGPDVFKDPSYAAQLYTKAADLGHIEANHRLGEAYEFGQLNCPKDAALSVHFYTGAAERGHAPSQMALCAWFLIGIENVLEKDEAEAYEWAKRAALQGLAKAQYTLAYFTEMGIGCRRDPLEANVWYVKAADQGDERAKHRISAIRRAAMGGEDPDQAAVKTKDKAKHSKASSDGAKPSKAGSDEAKPNKAVSDEATPAGEKKKRFGIF
ncbi:hypothetical protein DV737_g4104, partial [Chaetothyriales sp. CBS 132003]